VTFFSVAAVYVLLHAEFLAAVQVLVYAGGIMVLFLFVIMLVNLPREMGARGTSRKVHVTAALVLTLLTVAILAWYLAAGAPPSGGTDRAALGAHGGNLEAVSLAMFQYYVLPFEVVSILLMVAMVGAILLAKAKI
jgi:NADH-quinone oxidoreductase subunit J